MLLSELKNSLETSDTVTFLLPDGKPVPAHFHLTEMGIVTRHFIDCGGKERKEQVVNLQLWSSYDYHHRLKPETFLNIITMTEKRLQPGNVPVEVEYQGETIGRYDLSHSGGVFRLVPKSTTCLAGDTCGVDENPAPVHTKIQECRPGGGCC